MTCGQQGGSFLFDITQLLPLCMIGRLQIEGISLVSSDFLQITVRRVASAELHSFNRMAGNPSGPGAVLVVNSFMASANWESVKLILLSVGLSVLVVYCSGKSMLALVLSRGLLNTELY